MMTFADNASGSARRFTPRLIAACASIAFLGACAEDSAEADPKQVQESVLSTWENVLTNIRNCDQAHEKLVSTAQLWESDQASREALNEAIDTTEQVCGQGAERIEALEPPRVAETGNQVAFGSALETCEAAERTRLQFYPLFRQLIDNELEDMSKIDAIAEEHTEKSRLCGFSFAQQADEAGVDTAELERVSQEVTGGRGRQAAQ